MRARQVGTASGLLGLFSALGNLLGYGAAALAVRQSGSDPNAFFYGTMAIGVIGGLILSTALSLVVVPAFYVIAEKQIVGGLTAGSVKG